MHAPDNWLDVALSQYARANGRVCVTVAPTGKTSVRLRLNPCEGVAMSVSVSSDCALLADDARQACVVEYAQDGGRVVHPPVWSASSHAADAADTADTAEAAEDARAAGKDQEFVLYHSQGCGGCKDFMPTWDRFCDHCAENNISCRTVDVKVRAEEVPDDVKQVPAVVYNVGGARSPEHCGDMVTAIIERFGGQ